MTNAQVQGSKALPVRGVYLYFKALEAAAKSGHPNALEAFLTECDDNNLTLEVSAELFKVGHDHFEALTPPGTAGTLSAGPGCPACPKPPQLNNP